MMRSARGHSASYRFTGLRFGPPETAKAEKATKPAPAKRQRQKNDPKLIAAAREFRDRYMDEINSGKFLPEAWGAGKYDVSRPPQLGVGGGSGGGGGGGPPIVMESVPLLNAA